jgi:hypothetical protein
MYCMTLKVYTCEEAARGPKTFLNIFCKLLQQNEPSPAWQWSWFQYQLTLMYSSSLPHTVYSALKLISPRDTEGFLAQCIWYSRKALINLKKLQWVFILPAESRKQEDNSLPWIGILAFLLESVLRIRIILMRFRLRINPFRIASIVQISKIYSFWCCSG